MYCLECGTELKDGDIFCKMCGAKVQRTKSVIEAKDTNSIVERKKQSESTKEHIKEELIATPEDKTEETYSSKNAHSRKKETKKTIILVCILILLVLSYGVFYITSGTYIENKYTEEKIKEVIEKSNDEINCNFSRFSLYNDNISVSPNQIKYVSIIKINHNYDRWMNNNFYIPVLINIELDVGTIENVPVILEIDKLARCKRVISDKEEMFDHNQYYAIFDRSTESNFKYVHRIDYSTYDLMSYLNYDYAELDEAYLTYVSDDFSAVEFVVFWGTKPHELNNYDWVRFEFNSTNEQWQLVPAKIKQFGLSSIFTGIAIDDYGKTDANVDEDKLDDPLDMYY